MDTDHLKVICDLVRDLTQMRLSRCEHLSIENYAPELFGKLLCEYEPSRNVSGEESIKRCDHDWQIRDDALEASAKTVEEYGAGAPKSPMTEVLRILAQRIRELKWPTDVTDADRPTNYARLLRFAQSAAMYGDGADLQGMATTLLGEIGEPWH